MDIINKKEIIARHDQKLISEITEAVIEKPGFSVWMVILPVLLVVFMQRQKKYRQMCSEFMNGCLFTKNLALEAAIQVSSGIPELIVVKELETAVKRKPDAEMAIQKVYQAQLNEIYFLKEHYSRLLATDASEYAEMLQQAYSPQEYSIFLEGLARCERLVNEALIGLISDLEWRDIATKLEKETIARRKRVADLIFQD